MRSSWKFKGPRQFEDRDDPSVLNQSMFDFLLATDVGVLVEEL
jgi:hypothetical protein